jgi:hypothetical protein
MPAKYKNGEIAGASSCQECSHRCKGTSSPSILIHNPIMNKKDGALLSLSHLTITDSIDTEFGGMYGTLQSKKTV